MSKPVFKLPPFKVEHVVQSLSQVIGWGVKQSNIPDTWNVTRGKDVVCLVLDTGCTVHSDLAGGINISLSRTYISSEDIYDQNGHSTHVSGIIGARDNVDGMVGVAPEVTIVTYKVLDKNGSGGFSGIINGLKAAKALHPDVISMSLGAPQYNAQLHEIIKELHAMNIPIVCAAGNNPRSPVSYPAAFPETIAVTAFDEQGRPANFNSIGEAVDFSAPGVDIYSTYLNQQYAQLSGSSMSAPFVSGIVCLMIAKHRKQEEETGQNDARTVEEIKNHLIKYSDDKGAVGKDSNWGYGVIDPIGLIIDHSDEPIPSPPPPPEPPPKEPSRFCKWLYRKKKAVVNVFWA